MLRVDCSISALFPRASAASFFLMTKQSWTLSCHSSCVSGSENYQFFNTMMMYVRRLGQSYYCRPCDRPFWTEADYLKHVTTTGAHATPFTCGACGVISWSFQAAKEHMWTLHGTAFPRCEKCGVECNGVAALAAHMETNHPLVPYCEECDREFGSEMALQQHLNSASVHTSPAYSCEQCNLEFRSAFDLTQHLTSSAHMYYCRECNRSFVSQHALDQHLNSSVHVHRCEECDMEFVSPHALEQHLNGPVHVHRSDECDRDFVSEHALAQHLNSPAHVHRCEQCGWDFASKAALQQHLASPRHVHHCAPCDRNFVSRAALDQHLRSSVHRIVPRQSSEHPAVSPGAARAQHVSLCSAKATFSVHRSYVRVVCHTLTWTSNVGQSRLQKFSEADWCTSLPHSCT